MTEKPDPFGIDISVSSAKKNKPRTRRGMSGESETSRRLCDHEGCENAGKFRAPKAPDVLDDFFGSAKIMFVSIIKSGIFSRTRLKQN